MGLISVSVMAHPKRKHYVDDLLQRLDAPAEVTWDRVNDRWDTGRRAVASYDRDASHHLVLQDDAMPCRDLIAGLEKGLPTIGDQPFCLFFSKGTNAAHQRTNRLATRTKPPALLRFEGPWWGVAVLLPTALIDDMLRLADRPRESRAYDKRLSGALIAMGIDCTYILPSLVDHRLDGPSMIEGRDQEGRSAHHFIGQESSALDIDWPTLPVVDGHRTRNIRGRTVPIRRHVEPQLPRLPRPHSGPVSVSVAVMACQVRTQMAVELTEALDAPAEIVFDTKRDPFDTGAAAFRACDPDASHALVLQDDAIVPPGLVAGLHSVLSVVGDNPVGLYIGNIRPASQLMGAMVTHAEATHCPWVVGQGPWWGVGVIVPTHMIPDMLAWCDGVDIAAYDRRLAAYFTHAHIDCWYTMPSLVDHRTGHASLLPGRRPTTRKARRFIGSTPIDHIDWSVLPHTSGGAYVAYQAAGSRRFYQCIACGHSTPALHGIKSHVRSCAMVAV